MVESAAFVLDSFALLTYLQDEPAASRIEKLLEGAGKEKCRLLLSIISLGEILYITERRGGLVKAQDALALIQQLPIEILAADEQTVLAAANIERTILFPMLIPLWLRSAFRRMPQSSLPILNSMPWKKSCVWSGFRLRGDAATITEHIPQAIRCCCQPPRAPPNRCEQRSNNFRSRRI